MKYGYQTHNAEYQKWLIEQLIRRNPKVIQDFRDKRITEDLLPERFNVTSDMNDVQSLWTWITLHRDFEEGLKQLAIIECKYIHPLMDGINHINVYSKGRTELGKALSNFAPIGFIHPVDGKCRSVEGYWYYLATGRKYPQLKHLWGYEAKKEGRKYERIEVDGFIDLIKQAITCKIEQNGELKEDLRLSTLPLTHYYYYGDIDNPKVIPDKDSWFTDHLEEIRKGLQEAS